MLRNNQACVLNKHKRRRNRRASSKLRAATCALHLLKCAHQRGSCLFPPDACAILIAEPAHRAGPLLGRLSTFAHTFIRSACSEGPSQTGARIVYEIHVYEVRIPMIIFPDARKHTHCILFPPSGLKLVRVSGPCFAYPLAKQQDKTLGLPSTSLHSLSRSMKSFA